MPNTPEQDKDLTLSEIQRRYGLGRTALHARLKHCRIVPRRSGTRAYLTRSQIEVMDDLHTHLEAGRGMSDFYSPMAEVVEDDAGTEGGSAIIPNQPSQAKPFRIELPAGFVTPQRTRIDELREILQFLSDCAAMDWQLPTSEIREILGAAPQRSGWQRYGFTFEANGVHGKETSWTIRRSDSEDNHINRP